MDKKTAQNYIKLKRDPALFAKEILGVDLLPWQRVVAKNFIKPDNDYTAIASAVGTGKTLLLAVLTHHGLFCNNNIIIQICGPTFGQVRHGSFKEITRLYDEAPDEYKNLFTLTGSQMTRKDNKGSYCFIQTASAGKEESIQGVHSDIVYNFIDEASGVSDVVYEAIRNGMSTSNSKLLCTSNPRSLSGWFYDLFHTDKGKIFKKFKISSHDSSMVSQEYIDSIKSTYGEDHAEYKIKILGEFAEIDSESLAIVPDYLHLAFYYGSKTNKQPDNELPIWGIDVAGGGADKTILVSRTDKKVLSITQIHPTDLMEQSAEVTTLFEQATQKPKRIYVDSIGIGEGLASRLKEVFNKRDYGADRIVAVKSSHKPSDNIKYLNLKAEMFYKMCEWFNGKMRENGKVQVHGYGELRKLLREELFHLRQDFSSSGKILFKPTKDEYKKLLGRSPDVMDALALTFSGHVYSTEQRWDRVDYDKVAQDIRMY